MFTATLAVKNFNSFFFNLLGSIFSFVRHSFKTQRVSELIIDTTKISSVICGFLSCYLVFSDASPVFAETVKEATKSKKWPTYGWSSKYDEPNVNRVNLAYQTPPNPSNFTWTVVARPGTKENSAQAYIERELVGLVPGKQINFGKVIQPLSVRGFKHEIYYKFDAGGGETMWLSGSNLKLGEKR